MSTNINNTQLEVIDWGALDYKKAWDLQQQKVAARINEKACDCLIMVEHRPVVTLGKSSDQNDLRLPEKELKKRDVALFHVERGGRATLHSPGQLVLYPIVKLSQLDIHQYIQTFLRAIRQVLLSYGLDSELNPEIPGLWVCGKKIASIGVSIKKQVAFHGLALNVNNDLSLFNAIIPCGHPEEVMTSMAAETGFALNLEEVKQRIAEAFAQHFDYRIDPDLHQVNRHPQWLVLPSPQSQAGTETENLLHDLRLETVCQSAHCPNIGECFGCGTATFMIMGNHCTRNCLFCAVENAVPWPLDLDEPHRIAQAVKRLGLRYAVITSVTRDDLPDGGAGHFARTMEKIHTQCPGVDVEVLIPDFRGNAQALQCLCEAHPDMFNHNIETVPRLYGAARPQAIFRRSLDVLRYGANFGLPVKSGLMLGLGETNAEVADTLYQMFRAGCRFLTLGQYLSPSSDHLPVARYIPPDEFEYWSEKAKEIGFIEVASGPLVRSSYRAEAMGSLALAR